MNRASLLLIALLLTLSVTLTGAQIFNREGTYPDLSDYKSFKIYVEGKLQGFDSNDELEEESIDTSMLNDGPKFSIKGNGPVGKASIIGNMGTTECNFFTSGNSLVIVETPPAGSEHFLIIYNDWSKKAMGFKCVYVRHHHPIDMTSIDGKAAGSMLLVGTGIAKPI